MNNSATWPPTDGLRDHTQLWLESLMENRGQRLDPDYNPQEDIEDRLARIVAKSMRGVQVEYNEGGGGSWSKWVVPGLVSLAIMGIGGGVIMYGQLSALRQEVQGLHEQVNRVEKIVEPRYRGSP